MSVVALILVAPFTEVSKEPDIMTSEISVQRLGLINSTI